MIRLALIGAIALPWLGACLETPDEEPPIVMCETTLDCDHESGEICDDNICWGDPPDNVAFAAKLEPPETYPNLVSTEVPLISIATDGTVSGLDFSDYVTLTGRVLLECDEDGDASICDPSTSIAAQIVVRRPSAIPGTSDYEVSVVAAEGVASGNAAFTLRLPPTRDGDPPYEVSIVPDAGNLASTPYTGATPAEMAPPIRFSIEASSDVNGIEWVLGEPDEHRVVTGRVVDAAMRGMENMQVWALGTWASQTKTERGSSLGITDADGYFTLRVPIAMQDVFDLVAKPAPGNLVPTLTARDVYIPDPVPNEPETAFVVADMRMPSHSGAVAFTIPIKGFDSNGERVSIAGADVRFTTILLDDGMTRAAYESQAFSDVNGDVLVELIPGGLTETRTYFVRVTPPPTSVYASLFDIEISVPSGGVSLEQIMLERRIAIRGRLVNNFGKALPNTAVVAKPGLSFVTTLEASNQALLDDLQFPNTLTGENGDFVVWVDRELAGAPAAYDLEFSPPPGSSAPRWSKHNVSSDEVNSLGVIDVETVTLPAASYARGPVHTPLGDLVEGAEIRLFEVSDEELVCSSDNTSGDCVPGAILRGLWQSRPDGWVWMVVPEP